MVTLTAGPTQAASTPSTPSRPTPRIIRGNLAECPDCGGPVPLQNWNLAVRSEKQLQGGTLRDYGWKCGNCPAIHG